MDETDDGGDNIVVEAWIHIPITVLVFIEFCLAIQQLLGSPTEGNKRKVFRYRVTVAISTFTTLLISIALNLELTQDRIERDNGKDPDSKDDENDVVGEDFPYFIYFLMISYVSEALILGYWFFNDAVRAAYKATKGINQQAAPPKWIRKFWLVVIVIEESILVLCFIFAFAMRNTTFLNIIWITAFFVGSSGSGIVLACVISVYKSISSAITNNNDNKINDLKQARRTLSLIGLMGFVFGCLGLAAFINGLIGTMRTRNAFNRDNITSTVLDNPFRYLTYIWMIIFLNLILMLWTYRSSNINYCCFCWTYKKYTTNGDQHRKIDESVVCYKCFPTLIEEAEDRRQAIIEDSTNENTPNE